MGMLDVSERPERIGHHRVEEHPEAIREGLRGSLALQLEFFFESGHVDDDVLHHPLTPLEILCEFIGVLGVFLIEFFLLSTEYRARGHIDC